MTLDIKPIGKSSNYEVPKPTIFSDAYRHSIVESTYQQTTNLLTQVSGTPRLVEYYRNFLNEDEQPTAFSVADSPTYQSYSRIKDLVIKQEGDGSFEFDAEKAENSKTFSAYVSFTKPPSKYDVMISDIGDGRAGYFFVTEQPEILNFTSDKVYRITYQLMGILTEAIYNSLSSRVVEELVYSSDSALAGGTSLITNDDFDLAKKLHDWKATIAEHILHKFYWNDERTLAYDAKLLEQTVHYENGKVYDHALVNFARAVISGDLLFGYPGINLFSIEYADKEFGVGGNHNVFEALLRMNFRALNQARNKAVLIDPANIGSSRGYGNIRSSKFKYALILDKENYQTLHNYYGYDGAASYRTIPNEKIDYFFSDEFYNDSYETEFEKIVRNIAIEKVVDRRSLLSYCENYFNLSPIEQLYHGVIIIYLIELSRKFGPMDTVGTTFKPGEVDLLYLESQEPLKIELHWIGKEEERTIEIKSLVKGTYDRVSIVYLNSNGVSDLVPNAKDKETEVTINFPRSNESSDGEFLTGKVSGGLGLGDSPYEIRLENNSTDKLLVKRNDLRINRDYSEFTDYHYLKFETKASSVYKKVEIILTDEQDIELLDNDTLEISNLWSGTPFEESVPLRELVTRDYESVDIVFDNDEGLFDLYSTGLKEWTLEQIIFDSEGPTYEGKFKEISDDPIGASDTYRLTINEGTVDRLFFRRLEDIFDTGFRSYVFSFYLLFKGPVNSVRKKVTISMIDNKPIELVDDGILYLESIYDNKTDIEELDLTTLVDGEIDEVNLAFYDSNGVYNLFGLGEDKSQEETIIKYDTATHKGEFSKLPVTNTPVDLTHEISLVGLGNKTLRFTRKTNLKSTSYVNFNTSFYIIIRGHKTRVWKRVEISLSDKIVPIELIDNDPLVITSTWDNSSETISVAVGDLFLGDVYDSFMVFSNDDGDYNLETISTLTTSKDEVIVPLIGSSYSGNYSELPIGNMPANTSYSVELSTGTYDDHLVFKRLSSLKSLDYKTSSFSFYIKVTNPLNSGLKLVTINLEDKQFPIGLIDPRPLTIDSVFNDEGEEQQTWVVDDIFNGEIDDLSLVFFNANNIYDREANGTLKEDETTFNMPLNDESFRGHFDTLPVGGDSLEGVYTLSLIGDINPSLEFIRKTRLDETDYLDYAYGCYLRATNRVSIVYKQVNIKLEDVPPLVLLDEEPLIIEHENKGPIRNYTVDINSLITGPYDSVRLSASGPNGEPTRYIMITSTMTAIKERQDSSYPSTWVTDLRAGGIQYSGTTYNTSVVTLDSSTTDTLRISFESTLDDELKPVKVEEYTAESYLVITQGSKSVYKKIVARHVAAPIILELLDEEPLIIEYEDGSPDRNRTVDINSLIEGTYDRVRLSATGPNGETTKYVIIYSDETMIKDRQDSSYPSTWVTDLRAGGIRYGISTGEMYDTGAVTLSNTTTDTLRISFESTLDEDWKMIKVRELTAESYLVISNGPKTVYKKVITRHLGTPDRPALELTSPDPLIFTTTEVEKQMNWDVNIRDLVTEGYTKVRLTTTPGEGYNECVKKQRSFHKLPGEDSLRELITEVPTLPNTNGQTFGLEAKFTSNGILTPTLSLFSERTKTLKISNRIPRDDDNRIPYWNYTKANLYLEISNESGTVYKEIILVEKLTEDLKLINGEKLEILRDIETPSNVLTKIQPSAIVTGDFNKVELRYIKDGFSYAISGSSMDRVEEVSLSSALYPSDPDRPDLLQRLWEDILNAEEEVIGRVFSTYIATNAPNVVNISSSPLVLLPEHGGVHTVVTDFQICYIDTIRDIEVRKPVRVIISKELKVKDPNRFKHTTRVNQGWTTFDLDRFVEGTYDHLYLRFVVGEEAFAVTVRDSGITYGGKATVDAIFGAHVTGDGGQTLGGVQSRLSGNSIKPMIGGYVLNSHKDKHIRIYGNPTNISGPYRVWPIEFVFQACYLNTLTGHEIRKVIDVTMTN